MSLKSSGAGGGVSSARGDPDPRDGTWGPRRPSRPRRPRRPSAPRPSARRQHRACHRACQRACPRGGPAPGAGPPAARPGAGRAPRSAPGPGLRPPGRARRAPEGRVSPCGSLGSIAQHQRGRAGRGTRDWPVAWRAAGLRRGSRELAGWRGRPGRRSQARGTASQAAGAVTGHEVLAGPQVQRRAGMEGLLLGLQPPQEGNLPSRGQGYQRRFVGPLACDACQHRCASQQLRTQCFS